MRAAAMGEGVDARGGRVLTAGERYHVLSPHVLLQALERRHLARLGEVGEVVREVDRVVYFLCVHHVRRLRRWSDGDGNEAGRGEEGAALCH